MKKIIAVVLSIIISLAVIITIGHFTGIGKLTEKQSTKLSEEYVIYKARQYAQKEGQNLKEYSIKSVKYDSSRKTWSIHFEGNLRTIGNYFYIWINDQTEEIRLTPGM